MTIGRSSCAIVGDETKISRARMIGCTEKVTSAGSLGGLATVKLGKQVLQDGTSPPEGDLSSPSISLVMQLRPSDLSYCWSCSTVPPLILSTLPCH